MYRSEALQNLYQAQDAARFAQHALQLAQQLLEDSECDHPDTNGPTCAYCGVFHISEDSLQSQDDFNVLLADVQALQDENFPCLAPWGSVYYIPPTPPANQPGPPPAPDGRGPERSSKASML